MFSFLYFYYSRYPYGQLCCLVNTSRNRKYELAHGHIHEHIVFQLIHENNLSLKTNEEKILIGIMILYIHFITIVLVFNQFIIC